VLVDAGADRAGAAHRRACATASRRALITASLGPDDPRERAVARASRVDQRAVDPAHDLDARQDPGARPLRRPTQRGEQRATVHAEAVNALPQPGVGEVHEAPALDERSSV